MNAYFYQGSPIDILSLLAVTSYLIALGKVIHEKSKEPVHD